MADVPASGASLPRIELKSPQQESIFGPLLLGELQNALAAYVKNQGQANGSQLVSIVLNGPISGAQLPQPEIVPYHQAGGAAFLLSNLQDAVATYAKNQGQAKGPQLVFTHFLLDNIGGGPPKIELKPSQQEGIFGPFLLSDLQDALLAYAQNQGQASGPQPVSIVVNSPISRARLPLLDIVPNQQAGGEAFLLSDLQDALAAYVQNQGQASGPQLVFIYSRLDDPSGGGGGPPK